MATPSPALACLTPEAINNRFLASTDTFTDIFYQQTTAQDEWKDVFQQEPFPLGIGTNPVWTKWWNTIPFEDLSMTQLGLSDCETDYTACNPGSEYVNLPGQSKQTLAVYQSPYLRSPSICFTDLLFDHAPERAIQMSVEALMFRTRWYWNRLAMKNLADGVGHNVVVAPYSDGSLPDSPTTPAIAATQHIVQGVLVIVYEELQQLGAQGIGLPSTQKPVYNLYIGSEADNNFFKQSPDIRQDLRFIAAGGNSNSRDILTGGTMATADEVYGGFRHKLLRYPQRYDYVNGAYVERLPFTAGTCVTIGVRQEPSAAYRNAEFEKAFVLGTDEVMKWLTIPSPKNFGKARFGGPGTANYAGDFAWINFQTDCNPNMSKGYFLAQIRVGWYYPFPEYGYAIWFKRCPTPIGPYICSVNGVPSCDVPSYPAPPSADSPSVCVDPCLE